MTLQPVDLRTVDQKHKERTDSRRDEPHAAVPTIGEVRTTQVAASSTLQEAVTRGRRERNMGSHGRD
jgi:hypothetical protein